VAQDQIREEWRFEGELFSESFNPRRAIFSDQGRVGYLKVLAEGHDADPWLEQWANEQIVSELAASLGLPCVEARAGWVNGEPGAITLFLEGRKVQELSALRFAVEPIIASAANRAQVGLMVAFDFWVMNTDRGQHNVFITFEHGRPTIRLIDHGHTLLLPREQKGCSPPPNNWQDFVVSGAFDEQAFNQQVGRGFLWDLATREEILAGAQTVRGVPDTTIDSAVAGVDDEFICSDRVALSLLLKHRRDCLVECLGEGA
jgi:hypothetical protein